MKFSEWKAQFINELNKIRHKYPDRDWDYIIKKVKRAKKKDVVGLHIFLMLVAQEVEELQYILPPIEYLMNLE